MSNSNRDYRCAIPQRGRIELVDGKLLCRDHTGKLFGEVLIGPNRFLYVNGVELSLAQKGDPGKLRLVVEDETGQNSGGVISANRFRPGDPECVQEEIAQINLYSEPGTFKGIIRMLVRVGGENDWKNAFIASSQYLGRLWTGAANWIGWLGKEANPGDDPPRATDGRVLRIYDPTGRYFSQVQDDGNFVGYDQASGKPVALFDWFSIAARLDALERKAGLKKVA